MPQMLLSKPIAHVRVLRKGVHDRASVADDSTRRPRSVVLLLDVVDIPDMQSNRAGTEPIRS